MALNFKVGDRVSVDQGYIFDPSNNVPIKTTQALSLLGSERAVITDIGYILVDGQLTTRPLPIHIYPARTTNPLYRNGQGTIVYFKSEAQINASLLKV